ncbi:MAG: DUF3299 domain-containing protein [Paraglaciecola sp.]|nr:DUF3299 domain-containing protein [Paraglaciecola sp.]NCT47294.1 DUF3299 domain-containing protein [Paraglaciecola sp.]
MKWWLTSLVVCAAFTAQAEVVELYWEDMIPKGYIAPDVQVQHEGSMAQQNLDAPVVPSLDGKVVKIPGFVVPLESDQRLTTEFLLVPYFGACIHVPPPPPNQIVYVKFSTGVPIDNLNDAVWVTGTLSTSGWQGEMATVGYALTGITVTPYDG